MPRCAACPVAPDRECLGDTHPVAFAHLCRWATSDNPLEREMPALRSAMGYTVPMVMLPRGDEAGVAVATPVAPTVPLEVSLRRIATINLCPFRDKSIPCGCAGLAVCAAGNGRKGIVSHQDCVACIEADE